MEKPNAPKDPYKMVYVIFYWLGIGSLLPWNFFIAVNEYWMHKFRNTTEEAIHHPGDDDQPTSNVTDHKLSQLQIQWGSFLSIASMIPNVTFLLLNAVFGHRFRSKPRLLTALIIIIVLFIFSDVMVKVNTDSWQDAFLGVTLFTVVIINIMVAIFQGGLSGLAGKFPHSYMGAVVQGQALGGTFAAATNVVMLAFGANTVDAAFYDFLIAVIFLCSALVAFLVLNRTDFFHFYADESHLKSEGVADEKGDAPENEEKLLASDQDQNSAGGGQASGVEDVGRSQNNLLHICKRVWVWILAVFLCFLVTLAVFPAITVNVRSTGFGQGNSWSNIYFIPVGCFLIFNIGDFVGRILGSVLKWPTATHLGSLIVLAMSLARLAFIPLFLFCNASPDNRVYTSVYFFSDTAYIIFMVIFSVTNGYIGTIVMMFGPKMLENPQDQGQAASLLVSFLVLGLAVGAALSGLVVQLL